MSEHPAVQRIVEWLTRGTPPDQTAVLVIAPTSQYMRRSGDDRHDAVIKREILNEIVKTRYVLGVFDDRERVVDGWLTAGLKVFDVGGNVATF